MYRATFIVTVATAALLTLPFTAFADDHVAPEVFGSQDPNLPESVRYAETVKVGNMLYLSGVTGTPVQRDADDEALTANFVSIFEEVKTRLARAGATFDNVVTIETYRLDYVKNFALFNEVKNRYIKAPYPTWTDVGISTLPPGAVAELVVTAWLGGTRQEAVESPRKPPAALGEGAAISPATPDEPQASIR